VRPILAIVTLALIALLAVAGAGPGDEPRCADLVTDSVEEEADEELFAAAAEPVAIPPRQLPAPRPPALRPRTPRPPPLPPPER
jgi:hypothetical protein